LAGTDYYPNVRGKSFGSSRIAVASIKDISKADILLEEVFSSMEVPKSSHSGFRMALYQFLMPTVELAPGVGVPRKRMEDPSHLANIDLDILSTLEENSKDTRPRVTSNTSSIYKDIGLVPHLPLQSELHQHPLEPQPRPLAPQTQVKAIAGPSSKLSKRTLSGTPFEEESDSPTPAEESVKRRKKSNKTEYFENLKRQSRLYALLFFFFFTLLSLISPSSYIS
jgi:hypothetical protein